MPLLDLGSILGLFLAGLVVLAFNGQIRLFTFSLVHWPSDCPNHGAFGLSGGRPSSAQIILARSMNSFFGKEVGGYDHLRVASIIM